MRLEELLLSSVDIGFLTNSDGKINQIKLGAGQNFFAVVKSGYAIFTSAFERVELYPGELLYIPRGLVYTSEWYGEGGCRFYSLPFVFRNLPENGAYSLQKLACDEQGFLGRLEQMHGDKKTNPAKMISEFFLLYSEVAPRLQKREQSFDDSRVSRAVRYFETHVAEEFDVPTLAKMCEMSESGFYVEFKRLTGHTPIEYKNILRCRRAAELLINSKLSVESVAEKVGCSDASYLRRILYKELKKTPKQIRDEKQLM